MRASGLMRAPGLIRSLLLGVVLAAGLLLTGCEHATATSAPGVSSADPLGALEAGVDAVARQVDSDTAG